MTALETLVDGLDFGEGPRWHDGRLWYSDFFQGGVFAVGIDGTRERICTVPGQPSGLGWLPDGCVITPDGKTLIVGETAGQRYSAFPIEADGTLRTRDRWLWAAVPGTAPDGCTLDTGGGIWFADASAGQVLRVEEGGEITH